MVKHATFQERLKWAMDQRGVTEQKLLAEAGKLSEAAISKWLSGETRSPNAKYVFPVARFLRVNADWLISGTGPALNSALISESDGSPIEPLPVQSRMVRILGVAQLGMDGYWAAGELGDAGGSVDIGSNDAEAYALKVVGDSMHPRIRNGEYVVAEPSHRYGPGDEVVVVTIDGRAMVKEFLFARDGHVVLHSVNDAHGRMTLKQEEITSIHYVTAILKPDRFIHD